MARARIRSSLISWTRMRPVALGLVLGATTSAACALSPERLPDLDRRFYYNLPTPEDQQAFLKLRKADDRQVFLENKGLWQQWIALPKPQRDAVITNEVQAGFFEFAAFMAWGPPADTQTRDSNGRPMVRHTFIRCTSGPKAGKYVRNNLDCDGTSSETQITIRDALVVELKYPD